MSYILDNVLASKVNEKLYLNSDFADVNFVFKSDSEIQQLPAHKLILSVQSPVFNSMFYGDLREQGDVTIVDFSADEFKEFLQFFYLNKVTLTMENIDAVVRLADMYFVVDRISAYASLLEQQLTPKNMCWGYQLASMLNNETLIKFCEKEICLSPKEVFKSDAFLYCNKDVLERILEFGLATNEIEIFKAALEWAKCACQNDNPDEINVANMKSQLGNCLQQIRFSEMKIEEFMRCSASCAGLFTPIEFEDIVKMLTLKEYEPKIFKRNPRTYRYNIWNENKAFDCKRVVLHSTEYDIKSQEVVRISSNHLLLLGGISTQVHKRCDCYSSCSCYTITSVIITEIDEPQSANPKIHCDEFTNWSSNDFYYVLPQPVLIKPNTLYEIRLNVSKDSYHSKITSFWESSVQLQDGLIVQFYNAPSESYYASRGLISGLTFNHL